MRSLTLGLACLAVCLWVASAHCPSLCSGHGDCGLNNACFCWQDWQGGDCSQRKCPFGPAWADVAIGVDAAHQSAECSNRGVCSHLTGKCACMDGYEGISCNRMTCPNACNGHGTCSSMAFTASRKDPGTGQIFTYNNNWDANMIQGCTCDEGFTGFDCSLRHCPVGDDIMTNNHNAEILFQCDLTNAMSTMGFYLQYKLETTPFISKTATLQNVIDALLTLDTMQPFTMSFIYSNLVTSAPVCSADTIVKLVFTQEFGQPQDLIAVDAAGVKETAVRFAYDDGVTLSTTTTTYSAVTGTKEDAYCSGRGFCDQTTGICACYTGFVTSNGNLAAGTRGDCGFAADPITACPGLTECSGHGVCSSFPTYTCACEVGWMGGDCALKTCPVGYAWFEEPTANDVAHFTKTECSSKGICDRESGLCECQAMFEGQACERMTCPGVNLPCSGNGICTTMSGLAEFREINGDLLPTTYGLIPNKANTWDFKKVYGCQCDEGWRGYDCSERTCRYGDDSSTYFTVASAIHPTTKVEKLPETQMIGCHPVAVPTAGFGFQLKFRNFVTPFIPGAATRISDMKAILESLESIENVKVSSTTNIMSDFICGTGNYFYVTFLSPSGNVPSIQIIDPAPANYVDPLSISTQTQGTTDDNECSARGLCNRRTGACQCFLGYGSSDGGGLRGTRDDCGFEVPYPYPASQRFSDYRPGDLHLRYRPTLNSQGFDSLLEHDRAREQNRGWSELDERRQQRREKDQELNDF